MSSIIHGDDAAEALAFHHVLECLVDLRETNSVRHEFLQLQLLFIIMIFTSNQTAINSTFMYVNYKIYLVHVLLNHSRDVAAGFIVAEEGAFESPLVQHIDRMSFERIVFVRYSNEHGHAPTLQSPGRIQCPKLMYAVWDASSGVGKTVTS